MASGPGAPLIFVLIHNIDPLLSSRIIRWASLALVFKRDPEQPEGWLWRFILAHCPVWFTLWGSRMTGASSVQISFPSLWPPSLTLLLCKWTCGWETVNSKPRGRWAVALPSGLWQRARTCRGLSASSPRGHPPPPPLVRLKPLWKN